MANVQFQADADLNQAIVTGVIRRQSNIKFQTATEAGLEGLKDLEVLTLSALKVIVDRAIALYKKKKIRRSLASYSQ